MGLPVQQGQFQNLFRIATRGAAALALAALAACGGGSGEAASAASPNISAGTTATGTNYAAQPAPVLITMADLPYVDPAPLQKMMAQDDQTYAAMLANEWPRVENTLHQYIPPNVDFGFPTPMSFTGPWAVCMSQHYAPACREHMNSLIGLMNSKRPT